MRRPAWIPTASDLPGVALAAVIGALAIAATHALPSTPFLSSVLAGLVLGAVVLNTPVRGALGLTMPSADQDPDRYAAGLRFTGTWVLRLAIILMGLKVQSRSFAHGELRLILAVAAVALPSTFFVAHALGAAVGIRRPMVDLLAGGTMICGASAVNAIAPISKAHRGEQATAIAVISLFSIVALLVFRPVAIALGIDPSVAGLWSGLAVNDLSSAIAVGAQMGGDGGVMAAASKSARVLMLAPTLVALSLLRREGTPTSVRSSVAKAVPGFLLGYIGLAVLRGAGDRWLGADPTWARILAIDAFVVDALLTTVAAGMGLHLALGALLQSAPRALLVGGGASVWMAALTLATISAASRGAAPAAALAGGTALAASFVAYRIGSRADVQNRQLRQRFLSGAPLSLAESTRLLDLQESDGGLDDAFLRRVMVQLHPSIDELLPVRKSPLPHGEGCRWITYWEGASGWALVALSREPGATTPIHAHPHRMLGKAIEGALEELRFREVAAGEIELVSRGVLGHEELVEAEGLATIHVVRAAGRTAAIDLQLRGPETGRPGRVLCAPADVDVATLHVGARLRVTEEADCRPGHGGEGAHAGRVAPAAGDPG